MRLMNRLKVLVASCVVAAVSGCSMSVAHRDHEGCGEPGVFASHDTCKKCGKKSHRFTRTTPLFPGDSYGQVGGSMGCGCGEQMAFGASEMTMFDSGMYVDGHSGCSSCGGGMTGMTADGTMMSGGCGSQGGAINPQYLSPQPAPAMTPAPALQKVTPPAVPPAAADVAKPMPSPMDNQAAPMHDPVPEPFDAPKDDTFEADPNGAPPAETPADPVSWQVPVLPQ